MYFFQEELIQLIDLGLALSIIDIHFLGMLTGLVLAYWYKRPVLGVESTNSAPIFANNVK